MVGKYLVGKHLVGKCLVGKRPGINICKIQEVFILYQDISELQQKRQTDILKLIKTCEENKDQASNDFELKKGILYRKSLVLDVIVYRLNIWFTKF